jgi:hypothetical protein
MNHAILSASGSARWLTCAASREREQGIKGRPSNFAQEGTAAHALAEHLLTNNEVDASKYLGKEFEGIEVDQEMVENVESYINYVRSFDGELFVECRVDFSDWVPNGFGTSDAIVINERDQICHIIDLKYGRGVKVDAEYNTQAQLYALGVFADYGYLYQFNAIEVHIYQPRINHFSTWRVSVSALLLFGEYVKYRAAMAMVDGAPATPSEKGCQWCKAAMTCPELRDFVTATIGAEFDALDSLPPPARLSANEIAEVITGAPLVESWLSKVKEHGADLAAQGELPGFKMVEGRSLRRWRPDAEAQIIEVLGDDAYKKSLITPPQAEKLLGKKKSLIADLIEKPEGKPTLAPVSDKRKALENVKDMFTTIDNP